MLQLFSKRDPVYAVALEVPVSKILVIYILSRDRESGSPLKATARTLTRGHPKTL